MRNDKTTKQRSEAKKTVFNQERLESNRLSQTYKHADFF